jgi:hypothetical protein
MAVNAAILSIIIALFRRGRFSGLADLFDSVRHFWLILVPFVSVVIMWIGLGRVNHAHWTVISGVLHIVSTIAFVVFFALNLKIKGIWFFFVGQAMNLLPIAANGGKMPVSEAASKIANAGAVEGEMLRHCVMTSSTRFNLLADIVPIPVKFFPGVVSPGDVLIAIGIFILIQFAMCPPRKRVLGAENA